MTECDCGQCPEENPKLPHNFWVVLAIFVKYQCAYSKQLLEGKGPLGYGKPRKDE